VGRLAGAGGVIDFSNLIGLRELALRQELVDRRDGILGIVALLRLLFARRQFL